MHDMCVYCTYKYYILWASLVFHKKLLVFAKIQCIFTEHAEETIMIVLRL